VPKPGSPSGSEKSPLERAKEKENELAAVTGRRKSLAGSSDGWSNTSSQAGE
tara:strand:+ start:518 stop:673 length:156 start_codon:yes stop_codon:yes gene_type:complete